MNQITSNFSSQARFQIPKGLPFDQGLELYSEKFSELIIREAAKIAFDQWCHDGENSSAELAILQHFGLK